MRHHSLPCPRLSSLLWLWLLRRYADPAALRLRRRAMIFWEPGKPKSVRACAGFTSVRTPGTASSVPRHHRPDRLTAEQQQ